MPSFNDRNNKPWNVELTIAIARRTFDINKPEELAGIIDDPFKRFDLLWLICQSQAETAGVDINAFDQLLAEEGVASAADQALVLAIESFFRRIGKESLALLMAKTREAAATIDRIATDKVATMDQTLTQVITKAAATIDQAIMKAGNLSSNSPELSALTQTP